jgi:hypothetical protein
LRLDEWLVVLVLILGLLLDLSLIVCSMRESFEENPLPRLLVEVDLDEGFVRED